MKGFAFAFVFLAITACAVAEPPPEMRAAFDECKTEAGITDERPPHVEDGDPKAKCFHACIMTKLGKMVDGKASLEKELESPNTANFDNEKKAKVTDCVARANAESDKCEVAYVMYKCLKENNLLPPRHRHNPDN